MKSNSTVPTVTSGALAEKLGAPFSQMQGFSGEAFILALAGGKRKRRESPVEQSFSRELMPQRQLAPNGRKYEETAPISALSESEVNKVWR